MSTGWQCPGCGACYSPDVAACFHCTPRVGTFSSPGLPVFCAHEMVGKGMTGGPYCSKCGYRPPLTFTFDGSLS